jgi:2-hydroxychromene-2-carboxylate isomerase
VLIAIASDAGFGSAALRKTANSPAMRDELASVTDRGIARGVFGGPTFFVGDEMFWGKDRLDFVETHLKRQAMT